MTNALKLPIRGKHTQSLIASPDFRLHRLRFTANDLYRSSSWFRALRLAKDAGLINGIIAVQCTKPAPPWFGHDLGNGVFKDVPF